MLRAWLCAGLVALGACAGQADAPPRARVAEGVLEGVSQDGVHSFLGAPYAAPPLGDLRWRPPAPPRPWSGVRPARDHGPSCMQADMSQGTGPWTPEFFPHVGSSEDCLTLAIWTPERRRGARLPVLLWIPGGGYRNGGHAVPVNDGAALAREGMVVVSINYRVGAFGFLAHSELDGASGNFGARDALAALQWVRANAEAFGGDPERITIAGQSAGGGLVAVLLTAPEARGLFARAIIQSAPPGQRRWSDSAAAPQAETFAERLGAHQLEQMRAAPAQALLPISDSMNWGPFIDGHLIPVSPWTAFANGDFADVSILAGFTANERSAVVSLSAYASNAERIRLYPATDDAAANEALYAYERDRTRVGLERWVAARARHARTPVYLYQWSHAAPGPDSARFQAFHSSEMPYMFGAFDPARPYDQNDREISARMLTIWANFVRTGDPNGPGAPIWPQARAPDFAAMELGEAWRVLPPIAPDKRAHIDDNLERDGFPF